MAGYLGSVPVPQATQHRESFTATEGQTSFATAGYTPQFVDVYLNGSHLSPADFVATNGSDVVLGVAASADDVCDIISYTPFEVADQTFTGTTAVDVATVGGTLGVAGLVSPAAGITVVGSTTVDDILLTAVVLPGTGNPSLALRNTDNAVYLQSGSANEIFLLDSSRNTMAYFHDDAIQFAIDATTALSIDGNRDVIVANGGNLYTATAGTSNLRLGVNAGDSIVSGANENVLIGDEAGTSLVQHGINNTAVGFSALKFESAHGYNTAIGWSTLKNLEAGANGYNTAVGADSGRNMETGINNTLVGAESGHDINDGTGNTFLGVQAGDKTDDGANNVAVGFGSLGGNCGNNNVAIGEGAAIAATGGTNTVVGSGACGGSFSASGTVAVGRSAGNGIAGGNNNICIGNGADVAASGQVNGIALGVSITAAANDFSFGKASNVVTNDFDADAAFSRASDQRLKTNITAASLGLDFVNDLRPVTYKWKASADLDADDSELAHLRVADDDGNIINHMTTDITMHGLIAQEVKSALDTASVSTFRGWHEDRFGVQHISREMYVIPLIKAVQELSTALDAALARIATLEG